MNTIDGAKGWITKKRVLRQEVYKKVKSIQIVIQKSLCKDEQSSSGWPKFQIRRGIQNQITQKSTLK